jgi:ferrochelatase
MLWSLLSSCTASLRILHKSSVSNLAGVAVLLMAYGTPNSDDEIAPYLMNIRRGQPPSPDAVGELKQRYRKIGGRSPLLEITNRQASALEQKLNEDGFQASVYVGMKHWHPYINETVPEILRNDHERLVALALAPHYSQISIGGYKQALDKALSDSKIRLDFVESWYDNPLFHEAIAEKARDALNKFPVPEQVDIIFTAHSLPERILEKGNTYSSQVQASSQAVAHILGLSHWSLAYQSAGMTNEKWLGPDLLEELKSRGTGSSVLVVPIGFVSDHLEILYDIDVRAQGLANSRGLTLVRSESLNASPTFIRALAEIVKARVKTR